MIEINDRLCPSESHIDKNISIVHLYIKRKQKNAKKDLNLNQPSAYPCQPQQMKSFFWRPRKSWRDWGQKNLFILKFSVAVTLVYFSISLVRCASLPRSWEQFSWGPRKWRRGYRRCSPGSNSSGPSPCIWFWLASEQRLFSIYFLFSSSTQSY